MKSGSKYFELDKATVKQIQMLEGPVVVFGAGGFIGVNLLNSLLLYRNDVYGISQNYKNNWRFIATHTPQKNLISCDITDDSILKELIHKIKPRTIFNLAAYGAYSKQKEYKKIYDANFNSTVNIIEILKELGFDAYVHAGSSSEYGSNSNSPKENDELVPNSHYAVSKVASYFAIKYYGKIEKLPVVHLRLYSVYGPWEEPDRLIPVLISRARKKEFPPLVSPQISRDFIYIKDIINALILSAVKIKNIKGEAINIGSSKKTTIKELSETIRKEFKIPTKPKFNGMKNRNWDVEDWYANIDYARKKLGWKPEINIVEGLNLVNNWQKDVDFDNAYWNWNKQ